MAGPEAENETAISRETLGYVGDTRVALQQTSRPWASGVDVLVVSVGPRLLGGLGNAFLEEHPEADIPPRLLSAVTREAPVMLPLQRLSGNGDERGSLKALLLVTVHDRPDTPPTDAAVAAVPQVVDAALAVAASAGAKRIGLPLIGAGAIGAAPEQAASAVLSGIRLSSATAYFRELIVTVQDRVEADAVRSAWRVENAAFVGEGGSRRPARAKGGMDGAPARTALSTSAWRVLRRAIGASSEEEVVDDDLVFLSALVEATAVTRLLDDRVGPLRSLPGLLKLVSDAPFAGSDEEVFSFPGVAAVFERARAVAWQATSSDVVHARHLLAAAVLGDLSQPLLERLRATPEAMRGHLSDALREGDPSEWGSSSWAALLGTGGGVTGQLAGGVSADLVRPDRGLRTSDDHMAMSTYVGMMATVVARADTPLPLSIGLFGEWGSGKSTFMGLLRGRIDELSSSGSPEYLRDVVQIGFNAWTYADANLWASLGDEIFRALIGPEATDNDLRQQVRRELDAKLGQADDLVAARDRAVTEAATLQEELDHARTAYVGSLAALGRAVGEEALDRAWDALRVTDVGEQGRMLADEVRCGIHQEQVLRRTVTHPQAVWAVLLLAGSLVLVGVGAFLPALQTWLAGLGSLGLVVGLGLLGRAASAVRQALKTLADTAADVRDRVEDQAERRLEPELRALGRAEARVKVAEAQLDEVLSRAAQLRRELVDLEPGRRLYAFLNERAASGDYSGKLGLVSTIRRDFERLRDVLADWRDAHSQGEQGIDRIVLYIDDLDRCSPKQVVEVLQAVHLLLALDLFVVVVGVDPRWLLHSLRQEYREILDADPSADEAWLSTPTDYIEKIFNVPFVLPPMTPGTFESLVRGLGGATGGAGVATTSRGSAAQDPTHDRAHQPSVTVDLPDAAARPMPTPLVDRESGKSPSDHVVPSASEEAPTSRPITRAEMDLITALAPLVATPRQAKRLLNVYRMLRSTQDLGDASTWLGDAKTPGHHQAVALLLGLLTHDARLLGDLLYGADGLCVADPVGRTWRQVLQLRVSRYPDVWSDTAERLQPATAMITLPDVSAFASWGPHVARFSFVLSASGAR